MKSMFFKNHHLILITCFAIQGLNNLVASDIQDIFSASKEIINQSSTSYQLCPQSNPQLNPNLSPRLRTASVSQSTFRASSYEQSQIPADPHAFWDLQSFSQIPKAGNDQPEPVSRLIVSFETPSLMPHSSTFLDSIDLSEIEGIFNEKSQTGTGASTLINASLNTLANSELIPGAHPKTKASTPKTTGDKYGHIDKSKLQMLKGYIAENPDSKPRKIVEYANNQLQISDLSKKAANTLKKSVNKTKNGSFKYSHIDKSLLEKLKNYIIENPDSTTQQILEYATNELQIHDLPKAAIHSLKNGLMKTKNGSNKYGHLDKSILKKIREHIARNLDHTPRQIVEHAEKEWQVTNLSNGAANKLKSDVKARTIKKRSMTRKEPAQKMAKR